MLWFLHKSFSCLVTGPVLITPVASLTESSLQHKDPQVHCGHASDPTATVTCLPPVSSAQAAIPSRPLPNPWEFPKTWAPASSALDAPFMGIQTRLLQVPEQFELGMYVPNWGPFVILQSHRVFIFLKTLLFHFKDKPDH